MTTARTQMQAFFAFAKTWEARVCRTTFSDRVEFHIDPAGDITLTAHWTTRRGEPGQYSKVLTASDLFADVDGVPHLRHSRCFFIQLFMREILHSRGV